MLDPETGWTLIVAVLRLKGDHTRVTDMQAHHVIKWNSFQKKANKRITQSILCCTIIKTVTAETLCCTLKAGTHQPNHWTSEAFGETRTRSAPIQHTKSNEVGCQTSEPLDSLIGSVLANQRGVWEGQNTVCALVFYALHSVISCFHVLEYWPKLAIILSIQDELICVCLVMPRCMFSMQLFLSEIVKFRFDRK